MAVRARVLSGLDIQNGFLPPPMCGASDEMGDTTRESPQICISPLGIFIATFTATNDMCLPSEHVFQELVFLEAEEEVTRLLIT
jgi:hypothetical protein